MNINKIMIALGLLALAVPVQNLQAEPPAWFKSHGAKIGMALAGFAAHYAMAKIFQPGAKNIVTNLALRDKANDIRRYLNLCTSEEKQESTVHTFNLKWEGFEQKKATQISHHFATVASIIPMLVLRNPYYCAGEAAATLCSYIYNKIQTNKTASAVNAWLAKKLKQKEFEDAARQNNVKYMQELLGQPGINVNGKVTWGYSPLMLAICHQNLDMLKMLLSQPSIDVHATANNEDNFKGWNSIKLALEAKKEKNNDATSTAILKTLIENPKIWTLYIDEIKALLKEQNEQVAREAFCRKYLALYGEGATMIFIHVMKELSRMNKDQASIAAKSIKIDLEEID